MVEFVPRQVVGSFEIAARLDSGGMAEVFLGVRQGTSSVVVIKVLHEKWKDRRDMVELFTDEGRFMSRLSHPNVVQVVEHGQFRGRPYIAMEYLAGDHLGVFQRRVKKASRQMSFGLVGGIAQKVADGLAYVHNATGEDGRPLGLVHRDISPQNIFICYEGTVKILDFGIAVTTDRIAAGGTGLLRGKLRYMSPEQIQRKNLDPRSDLFSLGIVLWELLVGEKLFDLDTELDTLKFICEQDVPSPRSRLPDVPRELDFIVTRCLQRDPAQRYQNAMELKRALGDFQHSRAGYSSPGELPRLIAHVLASRQKKKNEVISLLLKEKSGGSAMPESLTDPFASSGDDGFDTTGDVLDGADSTAASGGAEISKEGDPGLVLRQALLAGEDGKAMGAYRLLTATGGQPNLDPALAMKLSEVLEMSGLYLDAARVCRQAAEKDLRGPLAAKALYKGGTLLVGPARKPEIGVGMLHYLVENFPDCEEASLAKNVLRRFEGPPAGRKNSR